MSAFRHLFMAEFEDNAIEAEHANVKTRMQ